MTLPIGWASVAISEVADLVNGDRGKNYPNQDQQLDEGHCLFLSSACQKTHEKPLMIQAGKS